MSQCAKAIALQAALIDDVVTAAERVSIGFAALGAVGVWVPDKP